MTDCIFCRIVSGEAALDTYIAKQWPDAIAFGPLRPVTVGHLLVIPKTHVADFTEEPEVSALTMRRASELMQGSPTPMNLITSKGVEATQSVFHLHLHLVPRAEYDDLKLPWHSGRGNC